MSEGQEAALPGSEFLWRAVALASAGGGAFLLATGRGSLSGAILLLVLGLAASGVLLGRGPQGPAVEGRLDLSARLGLGLLGGVLGAVLAAVARWVLVETGASSALGVTLTPMGAGPDLLMHLGTGAIWGLVLGVLYDYLPGASPSTRGAIFSLVPTLYLLLKVYPVDRDLGLLGIELGVLTFFFVFVLNMIWGMATGATVGWGAVSDESPISRPIDA